MSSSSSTAAPDGDAAAIAKLLRDDPSLCAKVAADVDAHTAARWAVAFSQRAVSKGSSEDFHPSSAGSSSPAVEKPTARQLRRLMVRTSIPFVGFGFFDNMIMLTVGETIDVTFGVTLGFSTMAAAGMGQMVSDASGITLQGLIERFADRLGLPDPRMSAEQMNLSFVRYWMIYSRIIGIVFGCGLGMFPLLLMPERHPRLVDQIAEKLSTSAKAEFMKCVDTRHCKEGELLLEWGQQSTHVFMVQTGEIDVIGRDSGGRDFKVCTIGPGHAFGVPALRVPSHCDLIATGDVTVQAISKDDFERITTESEASMQIFESARSQEHDVYWRSKGGLLDSGGGFVDRKGSGKTRFFASLSNEEKLEVLRATGLKEGKEFTGGKGEGKVAFFASLSEEHKAASLGRWQEQKKALSRKARSRLEEQRRAKLDER